MHRNFSVYITAAAAAVWNEKGKVDHDITRVVSGISDTAYSPIDAAREVARLVAG
jgi:ethanolamine ammonia-lyase large subunit